MARRGLHDEAVLGADVRIHHLQRPGFPLTLGDEPSDAEARHFAELLLIDIVAAYELATLRRSAGERGIHTYARRQQETPAVPSRPGGTDLRGPVHHIIKHVHGALHQ